MATTYELYTNENGTPKAVEGKAPAILERVEALEETLDNGVVTSVNGNTGNITPEQTGCLPTGGGTMTGVIYGEGGIIRGKTDASDVWISGGTNSSSNSYIQINGGSRTKQAGEIILVTKTPTSSYSLRATASGDLTWGGKDVVCVKSWNDGAFWYRKYADGFIEQGGRVTVTSAARFDSVTITHPIPFTNVPMFKTANGNDLSAVSTVIFNVDYNTTSDASRKTTTYVAFERLYNSTTSVTFQVYWFACGY